MNDNRRKLTGILKLLYENTDTDHSMNTYQIMDALENMDHGRPDRKTIDANIRFIIDELGFGIRKEKGKPNRYRWVEREFDLEELVDENRISVDLSSIMEDINGGENGEKQQ